MLRPRQTGPVYRSPGRPSAAFRVLVTLTSFSGRASACKRKRDLVGPRLHGRCERKAVSDLRLCLGEESRGQVGARRQNFVPAHTPEEIESAPRSPIHALHSLRRSAREKPAVRELRSRSACDDLAAMSPRIDVAGGDVIGDVRRASSLSDDPPCVFQLSASRKPRREFVDG